jgi:catechol 2,3-dioxygenase-like lactoylglutathione lyase family enzyme
MPSFKPQYVAVFSLWAEDVPAAVHFYRDVVGLDLLPHHGHRPAFDLGNGSHLIISLHGTQSHLIFPSLPLPSRSWTERLST